MFKDSVVVINPEAVSPLILTCEHASAAIPACYHNLGLQTGLLDTHIARDKGCKKLTEALARRFGVTAVIGAYSRLLIDLNRRSDEDELILSESDGISIPGNLQLTNAEREKRLQTYYWPYHQMIDNKISALQKQGITPLIFSLHAFTPQLRGGAFRPWQAGILYKNDNPFNQRVWARLSQYQNLRIEQNVPYDLRRYNTGSTVIHGTERGIDNSLIEIRDDEFADLPAGVAKWTEILAAVLAPDI